MSGPKAKPPRVRPCAGGCGKTLRPRSATVEECPGTVVVQGRNLCGTCYTTVTGGRTPRNGATNLREFVRYYPAGDTTSHELVLGHVVRVGADGWKVKVRADGTIRELSRSTWMAVSR